MTRLLTTFFVAALLAACATPQAPPLHISLLGSNDVHGELLVKEDRGGLITWSGYVNAVRQARQLDGGAVLLLDAGDMWQGTLESNLLEGEPVVAAYNALQYTAAAIGNHEFDFGPLGPSPIPETPADDPRGALKQRAKEAEFPFLAANLIDDTTGKPVDWENVYPSIIVDIENVKVGIIGVMTHNALVATIAANSVGLHVAPLAEAIEREARAARHAGASIIVVAAHAGGDCSNFDNPHDLSSCQTRHEIFRVAEALPKGLVDHIFAGHVHQGMAHIVNGISITSSYSRTQAFSRVDLVVDRNSGRILDRAIYPPTRLEPANTYEGIALVPDAQVAAIAEQAREYAAAIKERKVGITLLTPFELTADPESSLGNLYTDALLDATDADISIHTINSSIRANLPAGELTFGRVYEMSPFGNTLVIIELSGAELRQVISEQAHRGSRRIGFSGMRVRIACHDKPMQVEMHRDNGQVIQYADRIRVAAANYLATGGDRVFASVMPEGGFATPPDAPLIRDIIMSSLKKRGGEIRAADFASGGQRRWTLPPNLERNCRLRSSD
tara:strand:- start:2407 stop:4083 length:1677 start_codon:yes stop_codon:yes gene_type:complete